MIDLKWDSAEDCRFLNIYSTHWRKSWREERLACPISLLAQTPCDHECNVILLFATTELLDRFDDCFSKGFYRKMAMTIDGV